MTGMSAVSEQHQLLDNVLRLRRAERSAPSVEDISAVRADLERRIGHAVSRATAARLLGVSQTALDRWIGQGDIPTVVTARGRTEVPLDALLDLVEAVEERRRDTSVPHPLATVLHARRREADALDPAIVLPARYRRGTSRRGHRAAELRGLAYHRAVASRLDEQMVADARRRLGRWREDGRIDRRYAGAWDDVLKLPLPQIRRMIGRDSQRARDLRQSSPFAGALHERERQRVLELVAEAIR
jgi:hypothetical protein